MNHDLKKKLQAYKNRFYINLIIKGSLITFTTIFLIYLIFNVLEFSFRFNSVFRGVVFFGFITVVLVLLIRWIINPASRLMLRKNQISNEDAARNIGSFFPMVKDKLLNIIQLEKLGNNDLVKASIDQKSREISYTNFTQAIDFRKNVRYLRYFIPVSLLVIALFMITPDLFRESTYRIVNYKQEFVPEAPFQFVLNNSNLRAFKNEDFQITMDIEGKVIPENVYLNTGGRRIKLATDEAGHYEYTFHKVQNEEKFSFAAAGFSSVNYQLEVVSRPNIRDFNVFLSYPAYLNKSNERLSNIGNFQIPEGTNVQWQFSTIVSDSVDLFFENEDTTYAMLEKDDELYEFEKTVYQSDNYQVKLTNEYSSNKDIIRYHIDVIPDQYPDINLDQFQDTTFYNYMMLGGNISDDYGLYDLNLFYKLTADGNRPSNDYQQIAIPIDRSKTSQSFYYQWVMDNLNLDQGDRIEYFLQVRDNDGINGRKASRTSVYTFNVPTRQELKDDLDKSASETQSQAEKSIQKAEELNKELEEIADKLKGKKNLNWQDEKSLKDLIKEKETLAEEIKKLQEQFKTDAKKRDRFSKEVSKRISEKVKQLQQIMEDLLDEETKKLYDELQKLLEENKDLNEIQDVLDKISNTEENLEKEIERSLELMKQMQFEYKLEEAIQDMEDMAEEQEKLAEQTNESKKDELDKIQEEQEKLNEEYKENKESLEELNELNQNMENPRPMQDMSQEQQEIEQEQQKINDALQKQKKNQAGKSQQNTSQQMKKMSQKMQQMQRGMEMSMLQENLDDLRDIEDNMIKLSFNQEELMKDFRKVNQSDPRFIDLSQEQLKVKDDAKIIEDSLRSLAKRVFQIASFVTREVDQMNNQLDETVLALKERNKNKAVGKQQFAMTSMNNLALLLDDVLQQMQQQMADAMGQPMPKKGNKPLPSLSKLQQQLNEKINQLKKSGKTGRQLSEELAKLAAEQEMIRNAIKEGENDAEEKGQKGGSKGMGELMQKMEDTELDLVNKRLTQKLIERQQEILTRLLEAEESERERELDNERKGETAKETQREIPPAFKEYIELKEQEIELLKTVPPKMNPYYKKEVNEYFKRLKD